MDLVTAVAILVQQINELQITTSQLANQANLAQLLVAQENSVIAINPQVNALTANMDILISSIQSELTIVQQNIDRVAELSK